MGDNVITPKERAMLLLGSAALAWCVLGLIVLIGAWSA